MMDSSPTDFAIPPPNFDAKYAGSKIPAARKPDGRSNQRSAKRTAQTRIDAARSRFQVSAILPTKRPAAAAQTTMRAITRTALMALKRETTFSV